MKTGPTQNFEFITLRVRLPMNDVAPWDFLTDRYKPYDKICENGL